MHQQSIEFKYTARYFKIGEITAQTKAVWFVLHGYGQLAQYFLRKFNSLTAHNICVIAPEGLSHYYLQDAETRSRTGNTRVGASWMTRENRLTDIDNYCTYLDSVFQKELGEHKNIPVTLLGFSQGAATVSRWALSDRIRFEQLILWAGILPPDLDFEKGKEIFQEKDVKVVYGKNDPYLNESRFGEMKMLSEKLGLQADERTFEGGHEIHEPTLLSLI